MTEATFWKLTAGLMALLVLGILLFNLAGPTRIPTPFTSFLVGCLASIAIGYSVVCPTSSPALLTDAEEHTVRKRQYAAGIAMSIVLGSAMLTETVRSQPISWVLVPLILLPPVLILREYCAHRRMTRQKSSRD
jgi:hypothetical protein